ncbi:MAG: extracellular solute-binding protein [Clostridia bacterium]|nr:extracellular solute-binding protein [Clostridia bacterium]
MKKLNLITLRIISALLAMVLMVSVSIITVGAETYATNNEINAVYNYSDENAYTLYKEKHSGVKYADTDIVLQGGTEAYKDSADNEYKNTVTVNSKAQKLTYNFSVPYEGLYNIKLCYLPIDGKGNDINFALELDGAVPFTEAEQLILPRMYKDVAKGHYDEFGNQYSPEQEEAGEFVVKALYDDTGAENSPYAFYLTAGEHSITLTSGTEPFILAEIIIAAPDSLKPYSEIKTEYKKKGYTSADGEPLVIQGEDADLKSTRAIVPKSDSSSPVPQPSNSKKQIINYIGGSNWKSPTEEIVWKIKVEKSGLYRLGLVYKQDQTVNGYSYRQLKIDGKIPFAEAQSLEFYYGTGWQYYEFSTDDGEAYLFYLDKGEHTLSLAATMGVTAEYYNRLKQITEALSNIYLEIAMITGETPDSNRDYDLFKQIDGFNDNLEKNRKLLTELANDMKKLSDGEETSFISAVKNMARVLKSMIDNPYTAQNYVTDYYNNYTTLSSWLYDMKAMPLCVDRMHIYPSDSEEEAELPGFFTKLKFGFERFIASFVDDYNSNSSKDEALKIWINWGRDQAMVLNSLIEESFTAKTGIKVNLELTDATLVKGILSNNAPDLSLHLPRTEPVNLAMRGVLYDLTEFKDYDEVVKRFGESASVPYKYGNGTYALPDTQSFYIMFYRKDILESLEIEVPKTWDEFLAATAVLQRNNMQAWIPYTQITASTTVNTGVGGLNLFASVLQQFGSEFYNEDKTATILDSPTSLKAFTYWTDMYTKYKLPTTASFYNRFRVGTIPLGIEVYTQYTTLKEAAPEIDGRWGIALVPGVEENGEINHTVSGSGTGCAIMASSEHKDEAWEFLKWWTSADTQLRYNNNVESILGAVARTTTATLEAFEGMAWDPEDLQILLKQRENIMEIPEVAGSYYVSRAVDQAFWSVINGEETPKDSLTQWAEIANNEIERKIKQYSK